MVNVIKLMCSEHGLYFTVQRSLDNRDKGIIATELNKVYKKGLLESASLERIELFYDVEEMCNRKKIVNVADTMDYCKGSEVREIASGGFYHVTERVLRPMMRIIDEVLESIVGGEVNFNTEDNDFGVQLTSWLKTERLAIEEVLKKSFNKDIGDTTRTVDYIVLDKTETDNIKFHIHKYHTDDYVYKVDEKDVVVLYLLESKIYDYKTKTYSMFTKEDLNKFGEIPHCIRLNQGKIALDVSSDSLDFTEKDITEDTVGIYCDLLWSISNVPVLEYLIDKYVPGYVIVPESKSKTVVEDGYKLIHEDANPEVGLNINIIDYLETPFSGEGTFNRVVLTRDDKDNVYFIVKLYKHKCELSIDVIPDKSVPTKCYKNGFEIVNPSTRELTHDTWSVKLSEPQTESMKCRIYNPIKYNMSSDILSEVIVPSGAYLSKVMAKMIESLLRLSELDTDEMKVLKENINKEMVELTTGPYVG